jgi:hypothetical protein
VPETVIQEQEDELETEGSLPGLVTEAADVPPQDESDLDPSIYEGAAGDPQGSLDTWPTSKRVLATSFFCLSECRVTL